MNPIVKTLGIIGLVAGTLCFLHAMITAMLSGTGMILMDFNSAGEGWFEVAFGVISLPCGIYCLWKVTEL